MCVEIVPEQIWAHAQDSLGPYSLCYQLARAKLHGHFLKMSRFRFIRVHFYFHIIVVIVGWQPRAMGSCPKEPRWTAGS